MLAHLRPTWRATLDPPLGLGCTVGAAAGSQAPAVTPRPLGGIDAPILLEASGMRPNAGAGSRPLGVDALDEVELRRLAGTL